MPDSVNDIAGKGRAGGAFLLFLLLALTGLPATIRAEMPKWDDWRYEDYFTFRNGKSYVLDPYIWAYTAEFAERFRMPKCWIEPGLKGALAVAWRMTTIGRTLCGLGGRADSCWKPLNCQMDIYYDNRIELPWNYPEIQRDNVMLGLSSAEYIHDLSDSKRGRRYVFEGDKSKPRGIMNSGAALVYRGRYHRPSARLVYYDKEYEPGVGLIGYIGAGVCPDEKMKGPAVMDFKSLKELHEYFENKRRKADVPVVHVIEFPESYLSRLRGVYTEKNRPNEQTADRLIRQYFERRANDPDFWPQARRGR